MPRHSVWKPPLGTPLIPGHPLAQGLVADWLFNEGSGDRVHDATPNNTPAILTGYSWGLDRDGSRIVLDGSGGIVTDGVITIESQAVSVVFWYENVTPSDTEAVLEFSTNTNNFNDAFIIFTDGTDLFMFHHDLGSLSQHGITHPTGRVHVVAVFDKSRSAANEQVMYINGIQQSMSNPFESETSSQFGTHALHVGSRGDASLRASMKISGLKVYGRALDASSAQSLYAASYQMFGFDYWAWLSVSTAAAARIPRHPATIFQLPAVV